MAAYSEVRKGNRGSFASLRMTILRCGFVVSHPKREKTETRSGWGTPPIVADLEKTTPGYSASRGTCSNRRFQVR